MRTLATIQLALLVWFAGCTQPVGSADDVGDQAWVELAEPCTPDAPAFSLPAEKRDSISRPASGIVTPDAERAALAERVPGGFGGAYFDQATQRMTVVLTRMEEADEALRALGMEGAAVRQGRWDFAQMYDWYLYLTLHAYQGIKIVMSDIDEMENRIVFGVLDEADIDLLSDRLSSLGVPCFLVAVQLSEPIYMD